jgi:hypothetical protein
MYLNNVKYKFLKVIIFILNILVSLMIFIVIVLSAAYAQNYLNLNYN